MEACFYLLFVFLFGATCSAMGSPYVVDDVKIGGILDAKCLRNTLTGEFFEVILDYGGRVENLVLLPKSGGEIRSVLLSHDGNASAIMENLWWKGMLLIPWANRIAKGRYTFFNETYQLHTNENTANPKRVNALHGLLANKKMELSSTSLTNSSGVLVLSYNMNGDETGYPFKYKLLISYGLSSEGFSISFSLTNVMKETPLPVYIGWHPYLACTAYKAAVMLDKCSKWVHVGLNSNFNPTGCTELTNDFKSLTPIGGNATNPVLYDDEYKPLRSSNECEMLETKLYDFETNQMVVLWQDSNFRFVHVFTGSTAFFHENAIAIEPMSAMADAFNNHDHLSVLSGGETWTGTFGVYVDSIL